MREGMPKFKQHSAEGGQEIGAEISAAESALGENTEKLAASLENVDFQEIKPEDVEITKAKFAQIQEKLNVLLAAVAGAGIVGPLLESAASSHMVWDSIASGTLIAGVAGTLLLLGKTISKMRESHLLRHASEGRA